MEKSSAESRLPKQQAPGVEMCGLTGANEASQVNKGSKGCARWPLSESQPRMEEAGQVFHAINVSLEVKEAKLTTDLRVHEIRVCVYVCLYVHSCGTERLPYVRLCLWPGL